MTNVLLALLGGLVTIALAFDWGRRWSQKRDDELRLRMVQARRRNEAQRVRGTTRRLP
ncbi:MAG: hypothetical protein V3S01_06940 [Dehalococcoidia bacterium]